MSSSRRRKALLILLAAGAGALGIASLIWPGMNPVRLGRRVDVWFTHVTMPVSEIKTRKLARTLVERGWVWSEPNQNKLIEYDPSGAIYVNTKVPKKMIDRVEPGRRARITFAGFPEKPLPAVVVEIAPIPDPSMGGIRIAQYSTRVKADQGFPGIRPGTEAKVQIRLDGLDDVMSVPVQAVVHSDGQDLVACQQADGRFTWREVTLGIPTDNFVEIVRGLAGNEWVALNPHALMRLERSGVKLAPSTQLASRRRLSR